jgi:hypothetical protein
MRYYIHTDTYMNTVHEIWILAHPGLFKLLETNNKNFKKKYNWKTAKKRIRCGWRLLDKNYAGEKRMIELLKNEEFSPHYYALDVNNNTIPELCYWRKAVYIFN